MLFADDDKTMKCLKCGYTVSRPFPEYCPQCNSHLLQQRLKDKNTRQEPVSTNKRVKKFEQKQKAANIHKDGESASLDFMKMLKIQANPKIVETKVIESVAEPPKKEIQQMQVSTAKIDAQLAKIKDAEILSQSVIDREKVPLAGSSDEYIKFVGLVSQNREEIFSLNSTFTYLLDLAVNLEYIATSILSGQLDRMYLKSQDGTVEELCFFLKYNDIIFVIYGKIPDKKAIWLLNQIKITVNDYLRGHAVETLSKIEKYNVAQKFKKKIIFLLESIIELQDVFAPGKIESIETSLRVDYVGLSYQSIGILSKMITDELQINDLPQVPEDSLSDFEDAAELKEALITAKVEAIAANTYANTLMTPQWISVKLGYQKYRFILFLKLNDYYVSLLTEGNLKFQPRIYSHLKKILGRVTQKPFMGVLEEYIELTPHIVSQLKNLNATLFD